MINSSNSENKRDLGAGEKKSAGIPFDELWYSFEDIRKSAINLLAEAEKRMPNDGVDAKILASSYRDLPEAMKAFDRCFFEMCNSMADIHKAILAHGGEVPTIDNGGAEALVAVINRQDVFGLKTPYIRRTANRRSPTALPYERLMRLHIDAVDPIASHLCNVPEIVVYSISVYPIGTDLCRVLDNDNQSLKQPIDILTQKLERDDTGASTTLVVGAVLTDELDPGTYTFVTEKRSVLYTVDQAAIMLLEG